MIQTNRPDTLHTIRGARFAPPDRIRGLLLGALGYTLGVCLLAAQEAQVSLSASFSTDRAEAILFPGDSVRIGFDVGVHPDETESWKGVQIRIAANLPEGQEGFPVQVTARHASTGRGLVVALNQWYDAGQTGLSAKRPSLRVTVKHDGITRKGPLVLTGEVRSPRAANPASTALFKVNCAGFGLTDIGDPSDPSDDAEVTEDATIYMTHLPDKKRPIPVMPRLVSRVYGLPKSYRVNWQFKSAYRRRRPEDDMQFPAKGRLVLPATDAWRIFGSYYGNFFGGDASVSFEVNDPDGDRVYTGKRDFRILCENPVDDASRNYIKSRSGEFWFAWAISQHESRQWKLVYNQFNERGSRVVDEPNFGPPDGWGIFQIDSARGQAVTTREVWDWRENVFSGFEELKTAKQHSHDYIAAIKRAYPGSYDGLPPSYTPKGCKTTLTWEETSIMQLYNGASIVRKMKNAHGTWSYYRSCWKFYPGNPPGKKWKFIRNRNNYVWKVVKHEIEDQMGTKE